MSPRPRVSSPWPDRTALDLPTRHWRGPLSKLKLLGACTSKSLGRAIEDLYYTWDHPPRTGDDLMSWQGLIDGRNIHVPRKFSAAGISSCHVDSPQATITTATGRITQPPPAPAYMPHQDRHPGEHRSRHSARVVTAISPSQTYRSQPVPIPGARRAAASEAKHLSISSTYDMSRLSVPRGVSPGGSASASAGSYASRMSFDSPRACMRSSRPCADHEHATVGTGEVVEFIIEGTPHHPNHRYAVPARGVLKPTGVQRRRPSPARATNLALDRKISLDERSMERKRVSSSPPKPKALTEKRLSRLGQQLRAAPEPQVPRPEANLYAYLEKSVLQKWRHFPPVLGVEHERRASAAEANRGTRVLTWWTEDSRWSREMRHCEWGRTADSSYQVPGSLHACKCLGRGQVSESFSIS